jgi:hypothetical protein
MQWQTQLLQISMISITVTAARPPTSRFSFLACSHVALGLLSLQQALKRVIPSSCATGGWPLKSLLWTTQGSPKTIVLPLTIN